MVMATPVEGIQLTATEHKPAFVEPGTPVKSATVWYGQDLTPEDVAYSFTKQDVQEIKEAVAAVELRGLKVEEVTQKDFPLPMLGPKLEAIHKDLIYGRGIRVLRNVPLGLDVTIKQSVLALWGISTYFGTQQALSQAGHLVGHVSNDGGLRRRVSNCTPVPLGYHADNSDIVLLACRSQAKIGGASSSCSSHALHNEILARRPDLHKILAEPFYSDRKEWWPEGTLPYYKSPFFHYHENTLGVQEVQANIEEVAEHLGGPPVKEGQVEALRFAQEVAADPKLRFDITLQPGDILLNHNLTSFHSRGTWEDGEEESEKRHMMRIWIASPYGWPLDPLYAERWQSTEVGARGGLEVRPAFKRHVAVTPEEFHADYNAWYDLYGHVATTERLKPAAFFAKNAEILRKLYPSLPPLSNEAQQPQLLTLKA